MTYRCFLKNSKATLYSFASLLLLVATLLYTVAFFSNEWFILNPSHYGLWSVTFCDVLTCQAIPTVFNDQPGWYFLVQLFSVVGFVFTWSSLTLLVMTKLGKSQPCEMSTISVFCQVAVFSTLSGILTFFASLVLESETSLPAISWASSLATIACILETSACILIWQ